MEAGDEALLGWAQAPSRALWHRVRAISEANALPATLLQSACGLAFLSDRPVELMRPKEGPLCSACILTDDAEG
jgi:hypothetical protein